MKKKLLLMTILIAVLVFTFAITAFADDIIVSKTESDVYGTVIQLNADPGLDNAKQYVSTLKSINDAGTDKNALCILTDGAETPSYYVFPSSYIVDEMSYVNYKKSEGLFDITATDLSTAMAEFNKAMSTSYYAGYTVDGSGGGKRLNSIVRFEFPLDVTYAHHDYCCMRKYSKLVEVRFQDGHNISFLSTSFMFQANSKLATVTGLETLDSTKLGKGMFAGCSALRYIKLPTDIKTIPSSFFQGARGVNIVNMNELTELTTIGSWAFDGTQNLVITLPDSVTTIETSAFESAFQTGGSLTINPTSQLKTIGGVAFRYSKHLTSIYIPSTVTTIGERAFEDSGIKTLENFENCQITKLNNKVFNSSSIEAIKIPPTVTEISTAFMNNSNLKLVYIPRSVTVVADTFTGTAADVVFLYTGTDTSIFADCATLANAKVISSSEYNPASTYTGVSLVVCYSHCEAYLDVINVNQTCTACQNALETEKIGPIFICYGYSYSETEAQGISVRYAVDFEALKEYENVSKLELRYGLFVFINKEIGLGDIFDEELNAADGVISAEISSTNFSSFAIKLVGLENHQATEFAFGAYVAEESNEGRKFSYLQLGKPAENEKYYYASYNDIVSVQ